MTDAQRIAEEINRMVPEVKSGSLRFFGEWFGRPYDNAHQVVSAQAEHDILTIKFDEGETLTVWSPSGSKVSETEFEITYAGRVRWDWFLYGRDKTQANLRFEDFRVVKDRIQTAHNIDWYEPEFRPTLDLPAVRMYGPLDE